MLGRKTQNILVIFLVFIAIVIIAYAAGIFFKPTKELTGHKLLDCVYDDIQVLNIQRCLEKTPEYIDKTSVDMLLFDKARLFNDTSLCHIISNQDWKNSCLASTNKDKMYCEKIEDDFTKSLCLGGLGEENACNAFSGEQRTDCLVDISQDPEKCFLLPEYEQEFCFALRKESPSLCTALPTYYEQIRCLIEIDSSYFSQLENYYIFENFLQIAVEQRRTETCQYIKDEEFRNICIDTFKLII